MNWQSLFLKKIVINSYLCRSKSGFHKWIPLKISPLAVTIIGKRVLQAGTCQWEEDAGNVFQRDPKKDMPALLVVSDIYKKPFYISVQEYEKQIEEILQVDKILNQGKLI